MELTQLLSGSLLNNLIKLISKKLNIPEKQVRSVITTSIPLLLKALAKNTKDPKQAEDLTNAISHDHDGSILGNLTSLFSGETQTDGNKILKHILGNDLTKTTKTIAQKTNTKSTDVQNILVTLAPLLMGTLGKVQKEKKLNTHQTKELIERSARETGKEFNTGKILTDVLDKNRDGNLMDDLIGIVGKFLKKK